MRADEKNRSSNKDIIIQKAEKYRHYGGIFLLVITMRIFA